MASQKYFWLILISALYMWETHCSVLYAHYLARREVRWAVIKNERRPLSWDAHFHIAECLPGRMQQHVAGKTESSFTQKGMTKHMWTNIYWKCSAVISFLFNMMDQLKVTFMSFEHAFCFEHGFLRALGYNSSLLVNKKVKFQSNVISAVQETLKLHT